MESGERPQRPPLSRQPYQRDRSGVIDGIMPRGSRPALSPRPMPQPAVQPPPVTTEVPQPPVAAEPVSQLLPQPAVPQQPTFVQPLAEQQAVPEPSNSKRVVFPKKKLFFGVLTVLVLALLGGGVFGFFAWQAKQRDPAVLLRNGLNNSLGLRQVSVGIATPDTSRTNIFDFSTPNAPMVSSEGTQTMLGAKFGQATYGTTQNTYTSYTSLPDSVNAQTAGIVKNAWVQLRNQGQLPQTVDPLLSNDADPRYLAIGPVVIGNFSAKVRKQLVDYLLAQKVYSYTVTKAEKATDQDAYVIPVTLNVGYLKVSLQSAAASIGESPKDIQAAIDALGALKNAKGQLYISTKGHRIVKFVASNSVGNYTYTYGNFDHASVGAEPQTKLTWQTFASLHWQILSQAATKQPAQVLDQQRKAALDSLHTAFATYYEQNNSYPGPAVMNDLSWITGIAGVNQTTQRDPLAPNLQLSQTPKANIYAYQPLPASGKGSCDGKVVACTHYKLTATLSNGQQYTVQDP